MAHCLSPANTASAADRQAQVDFLRDHHLVVIEANDSNTWLDYHPRQPAGVLEGMIVRYYSRSDDSHSCMFGLVLPVNHPEVGDAVARYTRAGSHAPNESYAPEEDRFCLSYRPPRLSEGPAGETVATLRCDKLIDR
jgi:hypothetical protein